MPMNYYPVREYGLLLYDEEIEELGIDEDDLSNYSGIDGDFEPLSEGHESISFYEDSFYILSLTKEPTLFSRAYVDYKEIKAEIVAALGGEEDLPFNIDDRLGILIGVKFG